MVSRGLAVGLIAAGYGAGTALTVVPITVVINAAGYEAAFFWFVWSRAGWSFFWLGYCGRPIQGK